MKEEFPEYYVPSQEDFDQLWQNCLFVLDANVLLDLYRLSEGAAEALLMVLNHHAHRLWVPHWAALEYQKGRPGVIRSQVGLCKEFCRTMEDVWKKQLQQPVQDRKRGYPFVTEDSWERLNNAFDEVGKEVHQRGRELGDLLSKDYIRDGLDELLAGKVGPPYDAEKVKEICTQGETRYKNRVPPGYADSDKKEGTQKYGDLIIWFQMIDQGRETQKPIILVTGDQKEDWWWKEGETAIGPKPELIGEMRAEAGVDFYMYRTNEFVEHANEYLAQEQKVSEDAIEEMASIRLPSIELPRMDISAVTRALAAPQVQVFVEQAARMAELVQAARMAAVPAAQLAQAVRMATVPAAEVAQAARMAAVPMGQLVLSAGQVARMGLFAEQVARMARVGLFAEQAETKEASEDAIPEGTEPSAASDGATPLPSDPEEEADADDSESESEDE